MGQSPFPYVLDGHRQPTPIGVPGELFIGGLGVARGYLGRPDLTAERFVPDPFSGGPGARLYATGDLVRYRADGALEFLGRRDHQVKVRGMRLEFGEIEAALLAHPAVRQAVVLARTDTGDARLVGYVVIAPGPDGVSPPTPADLRAHLTTMLPDALVPAVYVVLSALPLTPNDKIDRAALPEPVRGQGDSQFLPPRTPEEAIVASIWSEVLRLPAVGVLDDFFELGGHSLLATQVVARLRDEIGVEVPLGKLFSARTVESLAVEVERVRSAGAGAIAECAIQPIPRSTVRSSRSMLERLNTK